MAVRVCRDCPRIIPAAAYKGRCPECSRRADKARGTRRERGYDAAHDREAKRWRAKITAGERVTCWRCGEPITDPSDCHLGHDDRDRSITRGPEHATCNLSAAGRNSHVS